MTPLLLLPVLPLSCCRCQLSLLCSTARAVLSCHPCEATLGVPAPSPAQMCLSSGTAGTPRAIRRCPFLIWKVPDPRREQAGCDPISAVPSHHTSWDPHPWAKGWELTENPLGSLLGEKFCLFGPKQSKDELMWISLRPVLTWTLKVAAGTCQGPAVLSQGKCSTVCLGALMFPPQGHAQPHTNVSAFSSAFLPVSDPLFCSRDLVCDGFPGTEVPTG